MTEVPEVTESPEAVAARRDTWELARRRAWFDDQVRRAEAAESAADREAESARSDQADQAAWRGFMRQAQGMPWVTTEAILLRAAQAEDPPGRDPLAPWGSDRNPAVFLDGRLVEPVARSRSASDEALLARARGLSEDPFMLGQVARFRQRRGGRPVAVRSEGPVCPACEAVGATPGQSTLIHMDPDVDQGQLAAEAASYSRGEPTARSYSTGTGWPSRVPMIYR